MTLTVCIHSENCSGFVFQTSIPTTNQKTARVWELPSFQHSSSGWNSATVIDTWILGNNQDWGKATLGRKPGPCLLAKQPGTASQKLNSQGYFQELKTISWNCLEEKETYIVLAGRWWNNLLIVTRNLQILRFDLEMPAFHFSASKKLLWRTQELATNLFKLMACDSRKLDNKT